MKLDDFIHCTDPSCECQVIVEEAKDFWKNEVDPMVKALGEMSYTGTGGGGLIKVTVNSKGYLANIEINPAFYNSPMNKLLPETLTQTVNSCFGESDKLYAAEKNKIVDKMVEFIKQAQTRMKNSSENNNNGFNELN